MEDDRTCLTLTRELDQSIVIGNPESPIAVITVSEIRGDRVRLQVLASRSVPINRLEVAQAIIKERKEVAHGQG